METTTPQLAQRAQSDPRSLSRAEARVLQRTIGNRAVARLFQGKAQRRLAAGVTPQTETPVSVLPSSSVVETGAIAQLLSTAPPLQQEANVQGSSLEVVSQNEAPLQSVAEIYSTEEKQHWLAGYLESMGGTAFRPVSR